MLEAQLAQSGLSDAEKAAIRAQAQAEGMSAGLNLTAAAVTAHQQAKREADIAWLEQAEETEQARHEKHIKSAEYEAYQAGLLAWHTEQKKKKQAEEERKKQSDTWAAFREVEKMSYVTAPMCGPEDVQQEKPWWEKVGIWGAHNASSAFSVGSGAYDSLQAHQAGKLVKTIDNGVYTTITGPRPARVTLGMNPWVNRIKTVNIRNLFTPATTRGLQSIARGMTGIGLAIDAISNTYLYQTGEYDEYEYGTSLTYDMGATLISGFFGGAAAGFVAGALVGAPWFGFGAIPAAIIGCVAGAVVGVVVAYSLVAIKEPIVQGVSDFLRENLTLPSNTPSIQQDEHRLPTPNNITPSINPTGTPTAPSATPTPAHTQPTTQTPQTPITTQTPAPSQTPSPAPDNPGGN